MKVNITHLKPFGVLIEPAKFANAKHNSVVDMAIEQLKKLFHEHQIIVLRGFVDFKNICEFENYCEQWGEISLWPFGKVLNLIEQENPEDHIFDHGYVPMHWDGMYRPEVPEYQIFRCLKAPKTNQGGRTVFANTVLMLSNISSETKNLWQKVTGIYQRKMEFYHSKTVAPVIVKHPYKNKLTVRYNELVASTKIAQFINPPNIEFIGLAGAELDKFHQTIQDSLYDPRNFYAHQWQDGDVVIADNFSLLHGREKFESKSARHIQRVHVLSNPVMNNPHLIAHSE